MVCESVEIREITTSEFKLDGFNPFETTVRPDIDYSMI